MRIFMTLSSLWLTIHLSSANAESGPPGERKSTKTSVLEKGAKVLQGKAPLRGIDTYLVGFHPMKLHPDRQMEAHHYCKQVNEDFAQCVLFDDSSKEARLTGVEYIISEKLFESLPVEERKYWHPHNYEILSGTLVAPGLPVAAEKEFLKQKMNSYGKTWHFWNTGHAGMKDSDQLPLGEPQLAWSFNRDGEMHPALFEGLESMLGGPVSEKRKQRQDLLSLAKPQEGVEALKGRFKGPVKDLPGVTEKKQH